MIRHRFLNSLTACFALLALAVGLTACGGGDRSTDEGDADTKQVADEASLKGIESGQLDVKLNLLAESSEGGDIDIALSGPFRSEGKGKPPQLDLTFALSGLLGALEISLDSGIVLLPNTAYIDFEGVDYKLDPATYSVVESALKWGSNDEGGADPSLAAACHEEIGELKIGEFIGDARSENGGEVGGVSTTKISGELDVPGAIDALVAIAESPPCREQLNGAGPFPSVSELESAKDDVESAIQEGAEIDVYVDDDGTARRIGARMEVDPQETGPGPGIIQVDLDLQLTNVNEKQTISAPPNAKPVRALFLRLGLDPVELLQVLQGKGGFGELLEKGLSGALARPQR